MWRRRMGQIISLIHLQACITGWTDSYENTTMERTWFKTWSLRHHIRFWLVLAAWRKQLKAIGWGNKQNKAVRRWRKNGGIRGFWPRCHTNSARNSLVFIVKSTWEARQCFEGELEVKMDSNGCKYYKWTEKISKTRQENAGTRQFKPKIFFIDPKAK